MDYAEYIQITVHTETMVKTPISRMSTAALRRLRFTPFRVQKAGKSMLRRDARVVCTLGNSAYARLVLSAESS